MGGAGRADARGDQGPLLNPAGMSLSRLYTVEGGYQFVTRDGGHVVRASVVDSTSAFRLAGGAVLRLPDGPTPRACRRLSGHEAGLSLAYPFADRVLLGVHGEVSDRVSGGAELDSRAKHSGFTVDAGLAIRVGLGADHRRRRLQPAGAVHPAGARVAGLWRRLAADCRPHLRRGRLSRFHHHRSHARHRDHAGGRRRIHLATEGGLSRRGWAGREASNTAI